MSDFASSFKEREGESRDQALLRSVQADFEVLRQNHHKLKIEYNSLYYNYTTIVKHIDAIKEGAKSFVPFSFNDYFQKCPESELACIADGIGEYGLTILALIEAVLRGCRTTIEHEGRIHFTTRHVMHRDFKTEYFTGVMVRNGWKIQRALDQGRLTEKRYVYFIRCLATADGVKS